MLPPRLTWPQPATVWRRSGERKPVDTPPFRVQRSAMCHTPYSRGLKWVPKFSSLSMRSPPVTAKRSVRRHSSSANSAHW